MISMQWHPRSMMAPPPVRRPSQNHAECGPRMGFPGSHPRDVADSPSVDGGDGLESLGGVTQVLEVSAENSRLLDNVKDAFRLFGRPREWLRTEDRFPCRGRKADRLLVQMVGQTHDHNIGVRVVDGFFHRGGRVGNAPSALEGGSPLVAP